MSVFLAWSQERSRELAEKLREWLKCVIQSADPWMSEEDIGKGERWTEEIDRRLATAKFGIICLTPENADSVWLHFEAGALSKAVKEKPRVCPYLLGLQRADVVGPLTMFQAALANRDDTLRLVESLNDVLEAHVEHDTLQRCFEQFWPRLESDIQKIAAKHPSSPERPKRTQQEILEEIVTTVRTLPDTAGRTRDILATVQELLSITKQQWRGLFGTPAQAPAPCSLAELKTLLGLGRLDQKPPAPKDT